MNKFQKLLGIQVQRIEQEMTAEKDRAAGYLRQQGDMHIKTLNSVGRDEIARISRRTAEQGQLISAAGNEQPSLIAAPSYEFRTVKMRPDFNEPGWQVWLVLLYMMEGGIILLFLKGTTKKDVVEWGNRANHWIAVNWAPTIDNWADAIAMNWTVILAVFLVVILVSVGLALKFEAFSRFLWDLYMDIYFLYAGVVAMFVSCMAVLAWFSVGSDFLKKWWLDEWGLSLNDALYVCGLVLALAAPWVAIKILFPYDDMVEAVILPPPSPPPPSPPKPTPKAPKNNILN